MARKSFLRRYLTLPKSRRSRLVAFLAIAVLLLAVLELTNTTHLLHKSVPPTKVVVTAGTTVKPPESKTPTTQPPTEKTPTSNTSRGQGGATDTGGSASSTANSSQWITSQSGYITVKSPAANAKLTDGSVIVGSAKVEEIHYRLIDNVVGVVAQGALGVVSGNFSGTLHFQPKGTGGRLDVFSTDSQGVEFNEVQINVSF